MTEKEKTSENPANIHACRLIEEEAPILPAPPSEVGVKGWLYHNIFKAYLMTLPYNLAQIRFDYFYRLFLCFRNTNI